MAAQLHCFGESGNAYKVALMLELTGRAWTPVRVDFFSGETRGAAFRALNAMGEVPVLVEGETVLSQSGVILDYLAGETGRFGAEGEAERREVLRWLLFDSQKVSGYAGPLRFQMNYLPAEKRKEEVIDFLSKRFASALKVLERWLDGREWLVGGRATIADLAACGYLYYPEPFGFDRAAYPGIDGWLDRIAGLEGWKPPYELMPRAWGAG